MDKQVQTTHTEIENQRELERNTNVRNGTTLLEQTTKRDDGSEHLRGACSQQRPRARPGTHAGTAFGTACYARTSPAPLLSDANKETTLARQPGTTEAL